MYGPNDISAKIPDQFKTNRKSGYIINYSKDRLFGIIVPFDNSTNDRYLVYLDDCHIYGARYLKRFQFVEFNIDNDAKTGKAINVLRSVSENEFVPLTLTANKKLPIDDNKRYIGTLMFVAENGDWFLIKPDDKGYEPVIWYPSNINAVGDCLEFNVLESTSGGLLMAINICAPSGKPILFETGKYARYLQTKLNLPTKQSQISEFNMNEYSNGTVLNGFITHYFNDSKIGQIEIESNDKDERYRPIYFKFDDVILPPNKSKNDRIFFRKGNKVNFQLKTIDFNQEFINLTKNDQFEPIIHLKAINIKSDGLDFFQYTKQEKLKQN